jgi:hypothetical protein
MKTKTVEIGTGPSNVADFVGALEASGYAITEEATKLLSMMTFRSLHKGMVNFVCFAANELDPCYGDHITVMQQAVNHLGLAICPNEVILQICLQHQVFLRSFLKGVLDSVVFGMLPCDPGRYFALCVEKHEGRLVISTTGPCHRPQHEENRCWIFMPGATVVPAQ